MNIEDLARAVKPHALNLPRPPVSEIEEKAREASQIPPAVQELIAFLDCRPEAVADNLEVGICHSGTACCRIARMPPTKAFVAVDPFGDVPYAARGGGLVSGMYTEETERKSLRNLFSYGGVCGVSAQHWKMLSLDWMDIILPRGYVRGGSWRPYCFSSVFLDGSHESHVVAQEIEKILPYLHRDGTIIIDNIDYEQSDKSVLAQAIVETAEKVGLHCVLLGPVENDAKWGWDPVAVLCRDAKLIKTVTGV